MPGRLTGVTPARGARTKLGPKQGPVAQEAMRPTEEVVALVLGDAGIPDSPQADQQVAFLYAYYESHGTLHRACGKAKVPYSQGKQWRDEDPRMKRFCADLDTILVEALHAAYWQRAMDPDQRQPAYSIFALKSRDVRYSERPMVAVPIQVNVTDGGKGGAVVNLAPALATPVPKALSA